MNDHRAPIRPGACLALTLLLTAAAQTAFPQIPPGEPISIPNRLTITLTNPIDDPRPGEAIMIPLATVFSLAPDFNRSFFRVKHPAVDFEPLDVPSQIVTIPGGTGTEVLAFTVDLAPREKMTLVLQYNPKGSDLPAYPAKTQVFGKWYSDGTNIAWESENIAYRAYSGVVDYFAKSYPELRLQTLMSDSYHHEAIWGVDPFVIGTKPGLCGIALLAGNTFMPYWGTADSLAYTHTAFGGGPVCAGAVIGVAAQGKPVVDQCCLLFAGHSDNLVRTIVYRKGVLIAPGMQKNDGDTVRLDEKLGYLVSEARAGEYGTIGMALVFRPEAFAGMIDRPDGRFVSLKPGPDGSVSYLSMGVWYRVSDEQPASIDVLANRAARMARCFANPVRVELKK
jgi:hypothetical protein